MTLKSFLGKYILRLLHKFMQMYWYIFRPRREGAKVILVHNNQFLLVRHTYNPHYWTLPGGGVKRGEDPVNAAHRELEEELGRKINTLEFLDKVYNDSQYKRDTIYTYYANLSNNFIKKDELEILDAKWFPIDKLPDVNPALQATLEKAKRQTEIRQ